MIIQSATSRIFWVTTARKSTLLPKTDFDWVTNSNFTGMLPKNHNTSPPEKKLNTLDITKCKVYITYCNGYPNNCNLYLEEEK